MGSEREKKFSRAWKRYEKARARAWDAFDAIEGPAWQEYEHAIRYHDMEKIPPSDPEPKP